MPPFLKIPSPSGALGVFYPQGEGKIVLKADIFKEPDQAAMIRQSVKVISEFTGRRPVCVMCASMALKCMKTWPLSSADPRA